jgi:hypothetical protein
VLIERILFLDGSPSMMPLEPKVGGMVKGRLESDRVLEVGAVKQYNDAVAIATKEGDKGIARPAGDPAPGERGARRLPGGPDAADQGVRLEELSHAADGRERRTGKGS